MAAECRGLLMTPERQRWLAKKVWDRPAQGKEREQVVVAFALLEAFLFHVDAIAEALDPKEGNSITKAHIRSGSEWPAIYEPWKKQYRKTRQLINEWVRHPTKRRWTADNPSWPIPQIAQSTEEILDRFLCHIGRVVLSDADRDELSGWVEALTYNVA